MTETKLKEAYSKLLALRTAQTMMQEELDSLLAAFAPPANGERKRKNLKAERIMQFSDKTWRKPSELKKKRA